ncbi:MAG: class I SAM-dependent methyltransferase [Thermoleophilaceae bacterium]|nr:class I SAM-dependent methyltransferase [Thermoleophilaceae bacterium]
MADVDSAQEQAHPERFDPEGSNGELVEAEHRARYWWAADYVESKDVLDAGCGTGFGTAMLAERHPARLVGVDIAPDALERARRLAPNAEIARGDLRELPFEDSSFDIVVCFEVIEHIERADEVLDELRRVLRETGCLLISSPNRDVYTPGNPHHVHEYLPDELEATLRSRFEHVELFRQHPWLSTSIRGDGATGDWRVASIGSPGGETYTLALASASPVDPREPLVVLGNVFEVRWWNEQVDGLRRALEAAHEAEAGARAQLADASRRLLDLEQRLARLPEMEYQVRQLQADAADVEIHRQIVRDMKASPSWRITAPLRRLKARLRR